MLVRSGRERRKGRYGRTVGVGRRLPFPICFSVMFAFCYQAYALPIKRRKGKKKKMCLLQTAWSVAILCPRLGGGVALEGTVCLSDLEIQDWPAAQEWWGVHISGLLLLSSCVNTDS